MSDATSLNILLLSGTRDRIVTAVNLAASALALGRPARLFLTWAPLPLLAAGKLDAAPLPDTFDDEAAARIDAALAGQPSLADSLASLREGGLELFACSNTVAMLGLDADALEAATDGLSGAAAFLAMAAGGDIVTL